MKINKKIGIIMILLFINLVFGKITYANDSYKKNIIYTSNYNIPVENIKYSPDLKSFAYMYEGLGKNEYGYSVKKYILIKDGKKIDESIDYIFFSYLEDGKSFIYSKGDDNYHNFLIKDGKIIEESEENIFKTYSPDGKSYAYIKRKNGCRFLKKDGKKISDCGEGINYKYSPDGKSFTYTILKDGGGTFYLIKDGKIIDESYCNFAFKYLLKGKSFAYIKSDNNHNLSLIKDGIEIAKYKGYCDERGFIYIDAAVNYSPLNDNYINARNFKENLDNFIGSSLDGKSFYYIDYNSNKGIYYLIKDGKIIDENKGGNNTGGGFAFMRYLPDGKSFVYLKFSGSFWNKKTRGYSERKVYLVKDGKIIDENKGILGLNFGYSPNGKSFTYIKTDSIVNGDTLDYVYTIIKDGKIIDKSDKLIFFSYSPDGNKFIYTKYNSSENKYYLIENGKIIDTMDIDSKVLNPGYNIFSKYSLDSKDFIYIKYNSSENKYYLIKMTSGINNNIDKNNIKYKKIDNILNKLFKKIQRDSKKQSKIFYRIILIKINHLIEKSTNVENIELLKYIKNKIEIEVLNNSLFDSLKDLFNNAIK